MKIKTKFDIGDKVFAIFKSIDSNKWYRFQDVCEIVKIEIEKNLDIVYSLKHINGFWKFEVWEKLCFVTEEEAQEKCDELNFENKFAKELEKAVERKVAEPLDKKL